MAKTIIFNEHKEAERILSEGLSRNLKYELSLLAKYYREKKYGFTRIKSELIDFCWKQNINPVLYNKLLDGAVNSARKYKLRNVDVKVSITEKEISAIRYLDRELAQILFVFLVVAKYEKYNSIKVNQNKPESLGYYCWHTFEDILKLAKVNKRKADVEKLKYKLDGELGLISATLISESNWKINFADDESRPIILVDNLDDILSFLPYYCKICGKEIQQMKKNTNICDSCYITKKRETVRLSVRKYRAKKIAK